MSGSLVPARMFGDGRLPYSRPADIVGVKREWGPTARWASRRATIWQPRTSQDSHIENLYRKIDAHNRAEATAFAFRHHLA